MSAVLLPPGWRCSIHRADWCQVEHLVDEGEFVRHGGVERTEDEDAPGEDFVKGGRVLWTRAIIDEWHPGCDDRGLDEPEVEVAIHEGSPEDKDFIYGLDAPWFNDKPFRRVPPPIRVTLSVARARAWAQAILDAADEAERLASTPVAEAMVPMGDTSTMVDTDDATLDRVAKIAGIA